ncbi:hypothetical protein ACA910_014299 [Epithemia clementina (nom. ined.)]
MSLEIYRVVVGGDKIGDGGGDVGGGVKAWNEYNSFDDISRGDEEAPAIDLARLGTEDNQRAEMIAANDDRLSPLCIAMASEEENKDKDHHCVNNEDKDEDKEDENETAPGMRKKRRHQRQQLPTLLVPPPPPPPVAHGETKAIRILRVVVLVVLLLTATLVSVGVYRYTRHEETSTFEREYQHNALKIMQAFHDAVERRLGAINTLSTAMTSLALYTNQSFPFVTMPDFALRGSDLRAQADAIAVHYMPLVTDDNRQEWERYALEHRFQIDQAFEQDAAFRQAQDEQFGFREQSNNNNNNTQTSAKSKAYDNFPPAGGRWLANNSDDNNNNNKDDHDEPEDQNTTIKMTIVKDGSGFHAKLWSHGLFSPEGDEVEGSGPYLPLWQRSPISAMKQSILNFNFANSEAFHGVLPKLLQTKEAIMHWATGPLTEPARQNLAANLAISQFRHEIGNFMVDPLTFLAYPVFDSFDPDTREIGGVLATNIHWRIFFEGILPLNAHGYICVLENSYNQTFAYRIDGNQATFLGDSDPHDPAFDYLEESASINQYVQQEAGPRTRSYTTVPLNQEFGKYTLRIYPSNETKESFETNYPVFYTVILLAVFLFTSMVFIAFAFVVERRQSIVMANAVANAEKAATTERELNEFLSHEIRNPLAAAISACSFVKSALTDSEDAHNNNKFPKRCSEKQICSEVVPHHSLLEDVKVIETSLSFVNDFLRSMLDIHRAAADEVGFDTCPVDLLEDVLKPVCTMLNQRCLKITVCCDCPENLIVSTYPLCLKQTLLHLGVPATNSAESGFVRFRAAVVNGFVELYVEDSGPGIPPHDRGRLFDVPENKFYDLRENNGIGLAFSQRLINALNGTIWLDENYDSGIENSPGSRFVIQLKQAPIVPVISSPLTNPISEETAKSSAIDDEPPSRLPLPENLSVLIVDDDVILRKLFSRAINRVAPTWKIQQAESGESALRLVADNADDPFSLIFMDQYMPHAALVEVDRTGTETIATLRARGVQSCICGLSANDIQAEFLGSGADSFMLKPIPKEKDAMEQWLGTLLGVA